jgi:polar amino acid transport system substrate-binding protein
MKKFFSLFVVLAMFSVVSPLHADTITLVADPWIPYTGEEGGEEAGFMIEFAVKVLEKAGHSVVYKNVPWDQAVEETRKGKYNAIVGAYKEDAPDFIFPENEQGLGSNSFFVSTGNPWKYSGVESLKGKKIGIMSGYSYGEVMDKFFKGNPDVVAESDLVKLLEKLSEGKIDTIIEDNNVFMDAAMKNYMDEDVAEAGSVGEHNLIYVAFSPADSKSKGYADVLSKGMVELRQSGTLKTILEKYGLEDWK